MIKRPLCACCLFLICCIVVLDALGVPLIRGNPLPASVQKQLDTGTEVLVYGEVVSTALTDYGSSLLLKNAHLIESSFDSKADTASFLSSLPLSISYLSHSQNQRQSQIQKAVSLPNLFRKSSLSQIIYGSHKQNAKDAAVVPIGNLRVYFQQEEALKAGSFVLLSGKPERIPACRNPGEFDSRQYYACDHIWYTLKKAKVIRSTQQYSFFRQTMLELCSHFAVLLDNVTEEDSPVFRAMLLGDRSGLESETRLRFQFAGIVHILAISGLHISIIGMGLFSLLRRLGMRIAPAGLASLFLLLGYGLMTGQGTSTLRAVIMCILLIGARLSGRVYDLPTALAAAAILLIIESPARLASSSFLLSFGAVAGVGFFGGSFVRAWKAVRPDFRKGISPIKMWILQKASLFIEAFLASLGVQIAALPILLFFYGEVSVIGLALNLLVLPTAGIVLVSGILSLIVGEAACRIGVSLLFGAARAAAFPGRFCLRCYQWLCDISLRLPFCTWIGGRPLISQICLYYLILLTSTFLLRKLSCPARSSSGKKRHFYIRLPVLHKAAFIKKRLLSLQHFCSGTGTIVGVSIFLLCFSVFILGYHHSSDLAITCLDVGQGDGIVISTPQRRHFLIDGGSSDKKNLGLYQLIPFLKSQGISQLDGIFISHTDEDHCSGVLELLQLGSKHLSTIRVKALYLPDWKNTDPMWSELAEYAEKNGAEVIPVSAGDQIISGSLSFHSIAPLRGTLGLDPNEDCMVLELSYKKFKGLFTGDIGVDTEDNLLPFLEDVNFLKVGHHGSKNSSGTSFLSKIRPELGVISCAKKNRYGHPSPEAIERLENIGCRLEYTMNSGAVTVRTDGERIRIKGYLS
ncbi:MAG: DNA internalization-related competence protein ComEC/Rec2 [Blautia sp.]|nr:DNA internalization-related competence protein ComEC/Rec2 [Blautia sp.]